MTKLLLNLKWLFWLLTKLESKYLIVTPPFFSRLIKFNKLNKKFSSIKIRNDKDFYVLKQIFIDNDYGIEKLLRKNQIINFYNSEHKKNKTPLIVDCGSNNGFSALFFKEAYPYSKVLGIEPDQDNFNISLINNNGNNNEFIHAAIGNEEGLAKLEDPHLGTWGYRIKKSKNGSIKVTTINKLLKKFNSLKFTPFIIKIDIEGFEDDLFMKNTEWVDLFPVIIIELHDWMLPGKGTSNNFLKRISRSNRDFVYIGENIFSISNTLLEDI